MVGEASQKPFRRPGVPAVARRVRALAYSLEHRRHTALHHTKGERPNEQKGVPVIFDSGFRLRHLSLREPSRYRPAGRKAKAGILRVEAIPLAPRVKAKTL